MNYLKSRWNSVILLYCNICNYWPLQKLRSDFLLLIKIQSTIPNSAAITESSQFVSPSAINARHTNEVIIPRLRSTLLASKHIQFNTLVQLIQLRAIKFTYDLHLLPYRREAISNALINFPIGTHKITNKQYARCFFLLNEKWTIYLQFSEHFIVLAL